jgi:hypothetical protein
MSFEYPRGSILHVENFKSCAICNSQSVIPSCHVKHFTFRGVPCVSLGIICGAPRSGKGALHKKGSCYRSGSSHRKGPRKPACLERYNVFQIPILGNLFQLFPLSSGHRPEVPRAMQSFTAENSRLSTFPRKDLTKYYNNLVSNSSNCCRLLHSLCRPQGIYYYQRSTPPNPEQCLFVPWAGRLPSIDMTWQRGT